MRKICLFGFLRWTSSFRARARPAFVFVWNGPTWVFEISEIGTRRASSPKRSTSIESFGYFDWISSTMASATFFAGVKRSSP